MKRKTTLAAVALAFLAFAAVVAASVQTARGSANYQQDCSNCHGAPGTYLNWVTALPSTNIVAPGAFYQVNIAMSPPVNGATGTGYWIANSGPFAATGSSTGVYAGGAGMGTSGKWIATMIAPTTPGIYYYKVFGESGPAGVNGLTGFMLYGITVSASATPMPTYTALPATPTSTNTPVPPTPTPTNTPMPPTPTPTDTPVPPTATSTNTPVPPTPTDTPVPPTPTPTDTPVPPTPTPTDIPVPPTPTSTNTPVPPTSEATPTTVPGRAKRGEALYNQYCASCHEPSSPSFVHKTIYGASQEDIEAGLNEEPMTGLTSILSPRDIFDIGVYLRTLSYKREKDLDGYAALALALALALGASIGE